MPWPRAPTRMFYLSSAPAVELQAADRAVARVSMQELLHLKQEGVHRQLMGVYADQLMKRDGRWLFQHRSFALRAQLDVQPGEL